MALSAPAASAPRKAASPAIKTVILLALQIKSCCPLCPYLVLVSSAILWRTGVAKLGPSGGKTNLPIALGAREISLWMKGPWGRSTGCGGC